VKAISGDDGMNWSDDRIVVQHPGGLNLFHKCPDRHQLKKACYGI
jgi:hypothetical protein